MVLLRCSSRRRPRCLYFSQTLLRRQCGPDRNVPVPYQFALANCAGHDKPCTMRTAVSPATLLLFHVHCTNHSVCTGSHKEKASQASLPSSVYMAVCVSYSAYRSIEQHIDTAEKRCGPAHRLAAAVVNVITKPIAHAHEHSKIQLIDGPGPVFHRYRNHQHLLLSRVKCREPKQKKVNRDMIPGSIIQRAHHPRMWSPSPRYLFLSYCGLMWGTNLDSCTACKYCKLWVRCKLGFGGVRDLHGNIHIFLLQRSSSKWTSYDNHRRRLCHEIRLSLPSSCF